MAFRKKILLLASKISLESGTYTGVTPSDPEYMILDPVVTDEMADVGMHVKVRKPRRIEEIAKKAGTSVEHAQAMVDELVKCGIVRCVYEGEDHDVETYYYPIWGSLIFCHDASLKSRVSISLYAKSSGTFMPEQPADSSPKSCRLTSQRLCFPQTALP